MTHTPGPWSVLAGTIIKSNDRGYIAKTPAANMPTFEEDRANARLIAAAPDLLEALKHMVLAFDVGDFAHTTLNGRGWSALDDARKAIARVEEGTP